VLARAATAAIAAAAAAALLAAAGMTLLAGQLVAGSPALAATRHDPPRRSNPLHVRVSPLAGRPDTVFRVGLDSPAHLTSPPPGSTENTRFLILGVGAVGPAASSGCESALYAERLHARPRERLRLTLAPSPERSPPRPLCPGAWRGTISTTEGVSCFVDPCPASPSFRRDVARFAFVVVSEP
jgi:hypothetical protein